MKSNKPFIFIWFFLFANVVCAAALHNKKNIIYGVTIDAVRPGLDEIVASLKDLPIKPIIRLVFDEHKEPNYYIIAASCLHKVSFIMGEILDSSAMDTHSVEEFKQRTDNYLHSQLAKNIDIWEIGNEINGEWLGDIDDVVAKMLYAYQETKRLHYKTALTLYYNSRCHPDKNHEMFNWAEKHIPADMKHNLDYVFISYYEKDCDNLRPDWQKIFIRLHKMFPDSKLGFGEIGDKNGSIKDKHEYLNRYYKMRIYVPNFVGGYFWWYYNRDMRRNYKKNPLWLALYNVMR